LGAGQNPLRSTFALFRRSSRTVMHPPLHGLLGMLPGILSRKPGAPRPPQSGGADQLAVGEQKASQRHGRPCAKRFYKRIERVIRPSNSVTYWPLIDTTRGPISVFLSDGRACYQGFQMQSESDRRCISVGGSAGRCATKRGFLCARSYQAVRLRARTVNLGTNNLEPETGTLLGGAACA
jgi:hypothetical protein